MKQLKDMGFGKSSMEDLIMEEVEKLSELLQKVNFEIISTCLKKFSQMYSQQVRRCSKIT